ncbi:hypothetical protein COHA_007349 [Chlorella ohadii]|uniref:Uncharacterized protein n=1 Tax=Chlorella ohadii TaxID=2649997 RepID=A0AAD5DM90_9CHLO|nr:hypothetical protein COHA_007349 [Chlorella ohadii]
MLKTHLGGLAKPNEVEAPGAGDAAKGCRLPKLVVYLDIGDKYPEWLEANKDKLSAEDLERYQQQQVYIRRICELYEASPSDYAQLVDLLQQMQQCGQPPQEIVDELAPGMQFGPDGLPSFGGDEQLPPELRDCVIQ